MQNKAERVNPLLINHVTSYMYDGEKGETSPKSDKPAFVPLRGTLARLASPFIPAINRGAFWRRRVIKLLTVIILCSLGFVIYSNTFYSSFHFDDEPSLVKNFNIRNLSKLSLIWNFSPTRFITYLSFAFNYHLHQLRVFGYHLFNLAIHLCTAILVWWFSLLTFTTPTMKKDEIAKHSNLIAFLTAAVFVSHPLQTEAVTYIVQRATSLSALFYLASLCLYIKSRVLEIEGTDSGQNHNLYYFASLITASVGMLTKEMLITLPLAVVLYEFIFLKTQHRLNWKKILSFFIISLIVPLIFLFTKSENSKELMQVFKYTPHIPRLSYLLTQFRVTVTYLRLLFIPWNQNLDYDYPVYNTLFQLPVFASLLFLILILVAAIRISSKYRLLAFGIFWFFLTLLPESSILPLADVIFEHRLYLPMLGYSISLVSIMYYLFKNRSIKAMVVILLLTVHWYAISAYNRNFDWRNEFTLWNDAVKKSPKKARPYGNRGVANIYLGNLDQAISDFNTEINLNPNYAEVEARSYGNRGVANIYLGNLDQAISDFNTVIYINPNYYEAYVHRGNAYATKGNFIQAFSDFDKALQINPQYAEAYYNRAVAYFLQKEYDKSWQDIHKAEGLGKIVNLDFLNALKKASKREK